MTSFLEPCRAYFEGVWLTEQLPSFLALFRCFVCSKVEISREIFEALTDLYQVSLTYNSIRSLLLGLQAPFASAGFESSRL